MVTIFFNVLAIMDVAFWHLVIFAGFHFSGGVILSNKTDWIMLNLYVKFDTLLYVRSNLNEIKDFYLKKLMDLFLCVCERFGMSSYHLKG